ncbi:hypothetical protein COO60DRAFT_22491 [Scenedesmus sp. NREL 46B-D3]|nr:hypothetical protein COO60DRAFT_22491 [Scenedesmus sp. NREL 46B-D3]
MVAGEVQLLLLLLRWWCWMSVSRAGSTCGIGRCLTCWFCAMHVLHDAAFGWVQVSALADQHVWFYVQQKKISRIVVVQGSAVQRSTLSLCAYRHLLSQLWGMLSQSLLHTYAVCVRRRGWGVRWGLFQAGGGKQRDMQPSAACIQVLRQMCGWQDVVDIMQLLAQATNNVHNNGERQP